MSYKPVILNYKAKEMFDEIFLEVEQTYKLLGRKFGGANIRVKYFQNGDVFYELEILDKDFLIFGSENLDELSRDVMKYFLELGD